MVFDSQTIATVLFLLIIISILLLIFQKDLKRAINRNRAYNMIGRWLIIQGLTLLEQHNQHDEILEYLSGKPGGLEVHEGMLDWLTTSDRQRPRKVIIAAVEEIFHLKQAVFNVNPYVPDELKYHVREGLRLLFIALWDSCQRFAIVKRDNLDRKEIKSVLLAECRRVVDVRNSAATARKQLTELTFWGAGNSVLNRDNARIEKYEDYFRQFYQDSQNLVQANAQIAPQ